MTSHCELCWIKTLPTDTHLSLDELMGLLPTKPKPIKRTTVCPEDGHSHDCADAQYLCHSDPQDPPFWTFPRGTPMRVTVTDVKDGVAYATIDRPKSWLPADWRMGYFVAHVVGVGLRLHRSLGECDCEPGTIAQTLWVYAQRTDV